MQFQELLDQYGVTYHVSGSKTRPGWYNFACPRCGKDPYCGFNIAGCYCSAWCCGYIPMVEVLMRITGLPGPECYRLMMDLPRESVAKTLKHGKLLIPQGVTRLGELHCEYLQSRGLDPQAITSRWHVGGIGPDGGFLRWRLYIPVHQHGEVVSWTTRAIGSKEPRYWSASVAESKVPIEECLYGLDHIRSAVLVTEGPIDAWAVGPGAVAICGLRVSPAQLQQLSRIPKRIICFDSEPVAQTRARRLLEDLSVFDGQTTNCVLQTGKDPASASKEEVSQLQELLRT